jgi:fatty acid desaturase
VFPAPDAGEDWRRPAVRRFAAAAAITIAGAVVAAAAGGTTALIGWAIMGVGLVVVVSLVFLEVGYSEDRERRQEAERRRRAARAARSSPPRHTSPGRPGARRRRG